MYRDRFRHVGERIAAMRKKAGLTQKALAKDVGIKPPSLSEIESGESKSPSALTLLKIAKRLSLDPHYLLTGEGQQIRLLDQVRADELRLLLLYRDLPAEQQHALEFHANTLHNHAHPVASPANPYAKTRASAK